MDLTLAVHIGDGQPMLAVNDFELIRIKDRPDMNWFVRKALTINRYIGATWGVVAVNESACHGLDLILTMGIEVPARDIEALQGITVVSGKLKRSWLE